MKIRTIRYVTAMVSLLICLVVLIIIGGYKNEIKPICGCLVLVSYVYWVPDENKDTKIVGVIQYDKENYDVPAMRIVFEGDPLNYIDCDKVTFKVDRNADLKDMA